jgi:hypothetical protein
MRQPSPKAAPFWAFSGAVALAAIFLVTSATAAVRRASVSHSALSQSAGQHLTGSKKH